MKRMSTQEGQGGLSIRMAAATVCLTQSNQAAMSACVCGGGGCTHIRIPCIV